MVLLEAVECKYFTVVDWLLFTVNYPLTASTSKHMYLCIYMYMYLCTCSYTGCLHVQGCAVVLYLVCLFDLACFFLSSFSCLIKNMYVHVVFF